MGFHSPFWLALRSDPDANPLLDDLARAERDENRRQDREYAHFSAAFSHMVQDDSPENRRHDRRQADKDKEEEARAYYQSYFQI